MAESLDHGAARIRVATSIAASYAEHPSLAAALCAGSTGRGHADQWSDLELLVLWKSPPAEACRRRIAVQHGNGPILHHYDDQERCWFDEWWHAGPAGTGLLVEITHLTLTDADHLLDRLIIDAEPNPALLAFASAVATGRAMTGSAQRLTSRVRRYPRDLAVAVVQRHGQIDHFWRWRMYVDRQDPHGLRAHFASVTHAITHTLCALNGRWWPGRKWPRQTLAGFDIKPAQLVDRLVLVDRSSPAKAAGELAALVNETYELVRDHLPEAGPDRLQAIFGFARSPWP